MRSAVTGTGDVVAELLGRAEPRLYTPQARLLDGPKASRGYEVLRVARLLGWRPMPWQRELFIRGLERRQDGSLRFRTVVVLVGRQSGKSSALQLLSLWRLAYYPGQTVLGTGQRLELARDVCKKAYRLAAANPAFAASLGRFRGNNNAYGFEVSAGPGGASAYKVMPQNESAGRGGSNGLVIIDEARELKGPAGEATYAALAPTVLAVPDGQVWLISNAGDDRSVVLNRLAALGLSGSDESVCTLEWSAPDGCDLFDDEALTYSSPALGHTLPLDALHTLRATMPPTQYRTEVLCQHVRSLDGAIDATAWEASADAEGAMLSGARTFGCVYVSAKCDRITLAVAQRRPDGGTRVGIAHTWSGLIPAQTELPEALKALRLSAIGWYPGPGGEPLRGVLEKQPRVQALSPADQPRAAQRFASEVLAGRVTHFDDPALSAAVGAAQRTRATAWKFVGDDPALWSAAGAVHLALNAPEPRRPAATHCEKGTERWRCFAGSRNLRRSKLPYAVGRPSR